MDWCCQLKKVLIFGSCVSRDVFNFHIPGVELVGYYSRSSFGSAFSSRHAVDNFSGRLTSKFQQRMVRADFVKEFQSTLDQLEYDNLLVDFIDERFQLFVGREGELVTVSAELGSSGFLDEADGQKIEAFSDDHFRFWERGWEKFIAQLNGKDKLRKLLVHRARWSTTIDDGTLFADWKISHAARANDHLSRIFARVNQDIGEEQVIESPVDLVVCKSGHRWGVQPFHYVDGYYEEIGRQIVNVV